MPVEVLQVQGVTKAFGANVAVDNISFNVKKGEVLGLLGPNGAGKTTAIRMIMGIIPQDSGEIAFSFNGKSTAMNKQKIGYLPEERGLYYESKVIDNLVYLAYLKGIDKPTGKKRALAWLDRMDLADYANQKLEKLSKGMQQKVQIIAAIIHQPPLLMLDEPFSGLDPVNQEVIKEIIGELRAAGTTILFSAHQMNLVEELCDSIFMIHRGKAVLSGSLQEIKSRYAEHIIHIAFKDGDAERLSTIPGVSLTKLASSSATLSYGGEESVNSLLQAISDILQVQEITVQKPPLHDIFIQTVRKRGEDIEQTELI